MKYPIILMDADDTLLDFNQTETCALRQVFHRFGVPDDDQTLSRYKAINLSWWKAFERGECEKSTLMWKRFAQLTESCGMSLSRQTLDELNIAYLDALGGYAFVLPGAESLCRSLKQKGHRLYVVTNGETTVQTRRIQASPLRDLLDGVFISEQMGTQKPQPAFFEQVFAAIGQPDKADCLLLGDSPTSDMLGGKRFGITTCWFNPHGNPGGDTWDYEIAQLSQLEAIVE